MGESYPSAMMQSVYSTALAVWACGGKVRASLVASMKATVNKVKTFDNAKILRHQNTEYWYAISLWSQETKIALNIFLLKTTTTTTKRKNKEKQSIYCWGLVDSINIILSKLSSILPPK